GEVGSHGRGPDRDPLALRGRGGESCAPAGARPLPLSPPPTRGGGILLAARDCIQVLRADVTWPSSNSVGCTSMHRVILAGVLALGLAAGAMAAAADLAPEEKALTQEIETRGLAGDALAKTHMARGTVRLLRKEMAGALADYDEAVDLAPKLAGAYLHRAIGRRESGDLAHAVDDVSQALALGPADPVGAYYLRADL